MTSDETSNNTNTYEDTGEARTGHAQPAVQIAAVTFMDYDSGLSEIVTTGVKPYFYLDPYGLEKGQHALVHNSNEFAIVRIQRKIPTSDPIIVKVTKAILGAVHYDTALVKETLNRLTEFNRQVEDMRIQSAIDKAMGYTGEDRSHRILPAPPAKVDDEEDYEGYVNLSPKKRSTRTRRYTG